MRESTWYPFIVVLLFAFLACNNSDVTENAVARVYDKYLYKSELARAIPFGLKGKDSAQFAEEYINQWLKQNLVLRKAENNLKDEEKDVSKQLEDYRISLITFAYERELVKQKLDTIVSMEEIEAYYNKHPNNFELKSNIIKLKYLKVPKNTPNIKKAAKWFKSDKPKDQDKLQQFAKLYAVNFLLDDSDWLMLDDVVKEIPLNEGNIQSFSNMPNVKELSDTKYHYLVSITGFMVKESQAPLEFERNRIKNIILNKRKILLIQKMQDDAYTDALNEKEIELF